MNRIIADQSHLKACRNAWLKHRHACRQCDDAVFSKAWHLGLNQSYCPVGQVIHDELIASHEAHIDLEQCEGTPCATTKT